MEPTANPEDGRQSHGLGRFWPASGKPGRDRTGPETDASGTEPREPGSEPLESGTEQREPGESGTELPDDRAPGTTGDADDPPLAESGGAPTPYAAPRPHPALTNDTKLVALGSRRPADTLLGGTTNGLRWTNQGGFPPVETNGHRNGEIEPRHGGTPSANGQSPAINGALPHSRSPFAPPPDTPPLYAPSPFAGAGNPPVPELPADPLAPPPPASGSDLPGNPLSARPESGGSGDPLDGRPASSRPGDPFSGHSVSSRPGDPLDGRPASSRPGDPLGGRPVSGQPAASGSAAVPLPPSTRPAAAQPVSGQPGGAPAPQAAEPAPHEAWGPPAHRGTSAGSASVPAGPGGAPLDPFPGFAPGTGQAAPDRFAPADPAAGDQLGGWGSEQAGFRLDPLPPAPLQPAQVPPGGRRAVPDLDEPQTGRRTAGDEDAARRAGDDRPGGRRSADDAPAGRRAARETADVAAGKPLRPGDLDASPISFWDEAAGERLRGEWHEVKAQFVDDPVAALTRAHDLLTDAVHELTESMLAERDQLDPLRGTEQPDTESMRMAMRGYREFLDRILGL
ncbi:hypothetical protein [Actinoplanes sp. NPDC049681]|uniref:hypothetical protein n=1 Tax=Actinoplanes sp. NPDC049681 TaxID=3363905 RepID=UPI00379D70E6